MTLTLGKRYELSGWVRTEALEVRDLDRSPIASGATLTMASMPFDVHSASVGGTEAWTHLALRFVASRTHDQILLTVGNGGSFHGKAWFEGIRLDEASSADDWPAREAVQTFGPAYRYPAAGWIYLHIEGKPYERGYQHGHLMAREIPEYLERCAALLGDKEHWQDYRTTANALFLRGFDREILEEMRGIAEGASDAGAKWQDRRIDLVDIVGATSRWNCAICASATSTTPTGLEGLALTHLRTSIAKRDSAAGPLQRLRRHRPRHARRQDGDRPCHLVAADAGRTDQRDAGRQAGQRAIASLMQSYPGGIESDTDWPRRESCARHRYRPQAACPQPSHRWRR